MTGHPRSTSRYKLSWTPTWKPWVTGHPRGTARFIWLFENHGWLDTHEVRQGLYGYLKTMGDWTPTKYSVWVQIQGTAKVNRMYLNSCFIPAHLFLCVLVFILRDRNVSSLCEITKFAWLDLTHTLPLYPCKTINSFMSICKITDEDDNEDIIMSLLLY